MKIAVCVPHTGTLKATTAQCLGTMLVDIASANITYNGKPTRPQIELLFLDAGPLEYKRTRLALTALERGSDYLLWIDSDQTFPNDALGRLMAHDKPIVGTNYASRHGGSPTAFGLDGKRLPRGSGLEQIGAVGLGFCLVKTPLLRTIPHPWFATETSPDAARVVGEDVHFCNQARAAGLSVWVDHDIEVGHITEQVLALGAQDIMERDETRSAPSMD